MTMPFWVLFDYILNRGSFNSVNLQESSVDLTPFLTEFYHEEGLHIQGLEYFLGVIGGCYVKPFI